MITLFEWPLEASIIACLQNNVRDRRNQVIRLLSARLSVLLVRIRNVRLHFRHHIFLIRLCLALLHLERLYILSSVLLLPFKISKVFGNVGASGGRALLYSSHDIGIFVVV